MLSSNKKHDDKANYKNYDYLSELRNENLKRNNGYKRRSNKSYQQCVIALNDTKLSKTQKVSQVMSKARQLEYKANNKESLLNLRSRSTSPYEQIEINDMLVNSVKAKMALLDEIQHD